MKKQSRREFVDSHLPDIAGRVAVVDFSGLPDLRAIDGPFGAPDGNGKTGLRNFLYNQITARDARGPKARRLSEENLTRALAAITDGSRFAANFAAAMREHRERFFRLAYPEHGQAVVVEGAGLVLCGKQDAPAGAPLFSESVPAHIHRLYPRPRDLPRGIEADFRFLHEVFHAVAKLRKIKFPAPAEHAEETAGDTFAALALPHFHPAGATAAFTRAAADMRMFLAFHHDPLYATTDCLRAAATEVERLRPDALLSVESAVETAVGLARERRTFTGKGALEKAKKLALENVTGLSYSAAYNALCKTPLGRYRHEYEEYLLAPLRLPMHLARAEQVENAHHATVERAPPGHAEFRARIRLFSL